MVYIQVIPGYDGPSPWVVRACYPAGHRSCIYCRADGGGMCTTVRLRTVETSGWETWVHLRSSFLLPLVGELCLDPSGCLERNYERSDRRRDFKPVYPMGTAMVRRVVAILTPGFMLRGVSSRVNIPPRVDQKRLIPRVFPYGSGHSRTVLDFLSRPQLGTTTRDGI